MIRLSEHILFLLRRHDNLSVPGIGTFRSTYVPAYMDMSEQLYFPPSRLYSFIPEFGNETDLILNSYKRKYGKFAGEAEKLLQSDIDEVKDSLKESGEVYLQNLGTLSLNSGKMSFEFSPLFKSINNYPLFPGITLGEKEPASSGPQEISDGQGIYELEKRQRKSDYFYLPIHKTFLRLVASLILVVTVGVFALIPYTGGNTHNTMSIIPLESHKQLSTKTEKVNDVASITISETQTALVSEEPEATKEDKFFLIVGSFKSLKDAEKFVNSTESKGWKLDIIPGKNINRVAIASSYSSEELLSRLNEKDIRKNFPDAWIWERP